VRPHRIRGTVVSRREPIAIWLPSTTEILAAPERAVLASLDANLALVIRVLKAEHPELSPHGRLAKGPDDEPLTIALPPIAEAMIICSEHLQRLVTEYRLLVDRLLDDANGRDEEEGLADGGDDIPF
jgi:hypothetical protein